MFLWIERLTAFTQGSNWCKQWSGFIACLDRETSLKFNSYMKIINILTNSIFIYVFKNASVRQICSRNKHPNEGAQYYYFIKKIVNSLIASPWSVNLLIIYKSADWRIFVYNIYVKCKGFFKKRDTNNLTSLICRMPGSGVTGIWAIKNCFTISVIFEVLTTFLLIFAHIKDGLKQYTFVSLFKYEVESIIYCLYHY